MSSRVEIDKYLVVINSVFAIVIKILDISVLFWVYQYLLKRIPTEEFSIYPIVMSVMFFLPLFTMVFTSGIARFIVEAYAKGDEEHVTEISSTMTAVLLAIALVILAGSTIILVYIDSIITIDKRFIFEARIMLGILLGDFALSLPLHPFTLGFYIQQKFVFFKLINMSMEVLRILILLVLLFYVSTSVLWLVVASTISSILKMVICIIVSLKLVPSLRFRFSHVKINLIGKLTTFGFWQLVMNLAYRIRMSSDPIILNKLATPLDVTSFHIGSMFFKHIQVALGLILQPLDPALIAIGTSDRQDRFNKIYALGGKYSLWFVLSSAIPLIIYRNELILLYVGNKYSDAATVMMLLLITSPITFGHVMLNKIAYALGNIRDLSLAMLIIQILNLVFTIYLVGVLKMGAVGSALSTAVMMSVGYIVLYVPVGFRLINVNYSIWAKDVLFWGILPGCIGGVVWMMLKIMLHPSTWMSLIFCGIIGGIFYLGGLMLFCLGQYERDMLKRGFSEIKSKMSWENHFGI